MRLISREAAADVVEMVEERAGARNRLVSETAMVHRVPRVARVRRPITLGQLLCRPGWLLCTRLGSEQDLQAPEIIDVPCGQLGGRASGGRDARRGLSMLMRWQAQRLVEETLTAINCLATHSEVGGDGLQLRSTQPLPSKSEQEHLARLQ